MVAVKVATDLRDALFRPASVALIGASDNPAKAASRPLRFLRATGWAGRVYPVNPSRDTVLGQRAWPEVAALPEVPAHALVLTTADAAVAAVRECAQAGVRVATVVADGFLETDPGGPQRRAALREILAGSPLRLVGPSSLGVVDVPSGCTLTANAAFAEPELPAGSLFVASQSGSIIGALASRGKAMGAGFAGLISTGGEFDLSLGEVCLSTVDDPGIASYGIFLENLASTPALREFAEAAAARGKPVLAYKLGRSAAGAALSVSHTGALAGNDAVADALLADLGFARVDTFEALLEGQRLAQAVPLTERGNRAPRVAVVTTTGGGGAMVVDRLGVAGAVIDGPSAATRDRLAAAGISAGHGGLVDLTLAGTRYDVMKSALDVLLTAPEFDAVVAVPGSSARFEPELAVRPIADSAQTGTPLAAFVVPEAPEALRLLRESGVSAFRTPESCADAVLAVFRRQRPRPGRLPADTAGPWRVLDEAASYEVLAALGVPHAPYTVLPPTTPQSAPWPGPLAVKAISPGLAHKTDAGGVLLGVAADGLDEAITSLRQRLGEHDAEVTGVLVQPMVSGLGEVLIGYRLDPAGPVVVLAAGGVLAEAIGDYSVRMAPVDPADAQEMIGELVSLRPLAGHRGAEPGDLTALAKAVVAISRAALLDPPVLEVEANPVIVRPDGVVAVDAVVRALDPQEGKP